VFGPGIFTWFQVLVLLILWTLLVLYLGGPRLRAWLQTLFPGLPDWVLFSLPWRRARMQRDFSANLAVLLDAGVPEADAVRLAAECTANATLMRHAEKTVKLLQQGVKLPDALQAVDNSPELRWRFTNVLGGRGSFAGALNGWHEALDARAFQLEQSAAQVTTTALVLANAAVVSCIVIGIFAGLVQLLNQATLW
jgi:type II secretory pathway component PulF